MSNWITSKAATSSCSKATIQSHTFLTISQENTGGRVLLLVKLQVDCSEQSFYTIITPPKMFSWMYLEIFQKM